jgi:2-keto-4-pentenoate hydratase
MELWMTGESERQAAAWIAARRRAGGSLADMPQNLKPADEDAGYLVQAAVLAAMAPEWGVPVGWKVGVTTPRMQAYLGLAAPIAGQMPARLRRAPGAAIAPAEHCRIGIECEIALVLQAPLGGGATRADAARAVGAIHPAIELVDDRYGGDYARFGVPAIVADCAFHAGFVLGAAVADWRRLDLAAVRGVTRANGTVVGEGVGADVMGHPMASLAWLANRLTGLGRRLEPGEIVLTGSLPLPYWASPGDAIEIALEGLGTVALRIG